MPTTLGGFEKVSYEVKPKKQKTKRSHPFCVDEERGADERETREGAERQRDAVPRICHARGRRGPDAAGIKLGFQGECVGGRSSQSFQGKKPSRAPKSLLGVVDPRPSYKVARSPNAYLLVPLKGALQAG